MGRVNDNVRQFTRTREHTTYTEVDKYAAKGGADLELAQQP